MSDKIQGIVSERYCRNAILSLLTRSSNGHYFGYHRSTTGEDNEDFMEYAISTSRDMPMCTTFDTGELRNLITPVLQKLMDIEESQIGLIRYKFNIMWPQRLPDSIHCTPHVDDEHEGVKTAIIYMNDADGDTIIYDKVYTGEDPKELKEIDRMTPRAGDAFVFEANRYHCNYPPTTGDRIVLNMVYVSNDNENDRSY